MALHCLTHYVRVDVWAGAGIIEGLENALGSEFFYLAVDLGKTQVEADEHSTFNGVDVKCYESRAGCVKFQVAAGAETLVVPLLDLAGWVYEIEAIVRFVGPGELVHRAEDDVNAEFFCKSHDAAGVLAKIFPVETDEAVVVGACVAAEGAFGKVGNIGAALRSLDHELLDPTAVGFNGCCDLKLACGDFEHFLDQSCGFIDSEHDIHILYCLAGSSFDHVIYRGKYDDPAFYNGGEYLAIIGMGDVL